MVTAGQDDILLDMEKKNRAAVALGKLRAASKTAPSMTEISEIGAALGGTARAKNLSAKRRKEIAKKAAAARWGKNK